MNKKKEDYYPGKDYQRLFDVINESAPNPLLSQMQDIILVVHEDFPTPPATVIQKEIEYCAKCGTTERAKEMCAKYQKDGSCDEIRKTVIESPMVIQPLQWVPVSINPPEERYSHTKGKEMSCYWHNDTKFWDKEGITHWLSIGESTRFKMPTDDQIVKAALLFADGNLDDKERLSDMVGLCLFVVDRLYENGDILIPSRKENEGK